MASFNKVTLLGNLTRDPEMRYAPTGLAIAAITLAVNRVWKNEAGEKQEEVSFIDCTAFGRTAEVVSEYVKKGNPLLVDGRLKQETWDDQKTGAKRSKLKVVIEHVVMLGAPNEKGKAPPPPPPGAKAPPQEVEEPVADDVPF